MSGFCGADCSKCPLYKNNCKGCSETDGCPFGKRCWISKLVKVGGMEQLNKFKNTLIEEFNELNIDGMPKVTDLYPLHGEFVNLEYTLPNGEKTKFLDDNEAYLGNQIDFPSNYSGIGKKKYFGVIGNTNFIMVCDYGENNSNPELLFYRKR